MLATLGPLAALRGQVNYANPYTIATLAGAPPAIVDGTGAAAEFDNPQSVAVDLSGNVYVADISNGAIRKVTTAGVVTTLSGTIYSTSVAVDASGNIYAANYGNDTIEKISAAGSVTTLAGSPGSVGSADGTGGAAQFNYPQGIAVDGSGNVYVADTGNNSIRMITAGGAVSTLAGAAAGLNSPFGVAVDGTGNVYVADTSNNLIRKITPGGVVSTLAGSTAGSADGAGSAAQFDAPEGVTVDVAGNVYVADTRNSTIRVITPSGLVTTLAGKSPLAGWVDGTGSAAQFDLPKAVCVDGSENVYVADTSNNSIRKITAGAVTTLAGSTSEDGIGSAARFSRPFGVAVDGSGNTYVADSGNNTIREITPSGVVTTFAGAPGENGLADGTGVNALFSKPYDVAIDASGNVFVADYGNNSIRKIAPSGAVSTFAQYNAPTGVAVDGSGNVYAAGGGNIREMTPAGATTFSMPLGATPWGIAVDGSGNIYVSDFSNNTIDKITQARAVTTLAGSPGSGGFVDGTGAAAQFLSPASLAVDGSGNIYVAEVSNNAIRKITPAGVVTTLAGGADGPQDGTGAAAGFAQPYGIAAGIAGNIYIADTNAGTIRKGGPSGALQIQVQPASQPVALGSSAVLSVTASGPSALSYQWSFGGSPIPGATSASYTVTNFQLSNAGSYTVAVSDGVASVTSSSATLAQANLARLINISTRAQVGIGANILIPGFVIGGRGTETLLIRADGPSLAQFGVSGVLAQPSLVVTNSAGTVVASNTGWATNPNPAQIASVAASVGAFALPSGSADSAVIVSLASGSYTVQVSGVGNTTGVALAEVYEVSSSGTRLVNISTRAQVGTGSSIIIPGFVISGAGNEPLLVRADGPGLSQFGVGGVLAQPSLSVFDSTGKLVASNTGWGTNSNPTFIASTATSVGAFALTAGSADSAAFVSLTLGAYTMQVSGVNNTTGVALAEVYEVP